MYTGETSYTLKTAEYTAGLIRGIVFKTQEEVSHESYVGFYIPKIMGLIDPATGPSETVEPIIATVFANDAEHLLVLPPVIPTVNYIRAKYNYHSNITQPIIALGESAFIFFFEGDYKRPYYTNYGNNEAKRKTDEVKLFVYGKPEADKPGDDSYHLFLTSKTKKLILHTSKENGEKHTYDLIFNAAESTATLTDDDGNYLTLETEKKRIMIENKDKSSVELTKRNINIHCEDTCKITCRDYKVEALATIKESAKISFDVKTPLTTIDADVLMKIITTAMLCEVKTIFTCTSPFSTYGGILGAVTICVTPVPNQTPNIQTINTSGSILSPTPMHLSSNAIPTVGGLLALCPFTTIPQAALGVVAPFAALIPNTFVRQ
jgi:hypothetical protein